MSAPAAESFQLSDYIMHHVANSNEWHLPFNIHVTLPAYLSLHGLMALLGAAILILLFTVFYNRDDRVPTGLTNVLELGVIFVRDQIVYPFLGENDGRKFLPVFCTFFFFILTLNLMGNIPLFATATANINFTAGLAIITFFLMTIGGIFRHGPIGFLRLFAPSGVPVPVLFILAPIEFVGLFTKPIALMIRLFVAMLAGHIVIAAFLGLILTFGIFALPIIVLPVAISGLEVGVAFLQAYIFTFLSALYLGQILHPEH
jgi:F-type H+-transporting ATPase subunit a